MMLIFAIELKQQLNDKTNTPIAPLPQSRLEQDEGMLSEEQRRVLKLAMQGKNIFLTGLAGTGKTFLLQVIIRKLEQANRKVAITASTGMINDIYFLLVTRFAGIAAVPLDGVTLHSFAGTGVPCVYLDFEKMWDEKHREK